LTPDWQADPQFRDAGGFIAERAWPQALSLHRGHEKIYPCGVAARPVKIRTGHGGFED
jgi:hypothetical protein